MIGAERRLPSLRAVLALVVAGVIGNAGSARGGAFEVAEQGSCVGLAGACSGTAVATSSVSEWSLSVMVVSSSWM